MKKFNENEIRDLRIAQIIDANLDRAREGLRVLEDWARFGLGREDLVTEIKHYRHLLGKEHLYFYKRTRNYIKDHCQGISHPEQKKRVKASNLICSNAARVQEALRVIEEFSRSHNINLSQTVSNIRYKIYDLEINLLEAESNKSIKDILKKNNLYCLSTDSNHLLGTIEQILEGGVKLIQHRFKNGNDKRNFSDALKIKKLCSKFSAIFIINDRVDIAFACDADGVHLGQSDLDIRSARKILGFSKIIGISANNKTDINRAIVEGCDYLGIGPLYSSPTKKDKKPLGIDKVLQITKDISIPWFAIGGINSKNISILKNNGIQKVAIVSDIFYDKNPKNKARIIINALADEYQSKR